jgi:hypothetical protein
MADRKRVNVTVSPAQKEKWDDAVAESPEYSSLSGLIRTAVAHELSDSPGVASRNAGGHETQQVEAQMQALDQVTDTLSHMENTLSDLDQRLTNVEKEVTSTGRAELKNDIIDALPETQSDEGPTGKSAKEVAEEIGENQDRVDELLSQMGREMGIIETVEAIEGQQFYARIGGI